MNHTVIQLFKKFTVFIEPNGSVLLSQEPTTGPYSKPDESSPHLHTQLLLILSSHLCLVLQSVFLLPSFWSKFWTHFVLLRLIALIIFVKGYLL